MATKEIVSFVVFRFSALFEFAAFLPFLSLLLLPLFRYLHIERWCFQSLFECLVSGCSTSTGSPNILHMDKIMSCLKQSELLRFAEEDCNAMQQCSHKICKKYPITTLFLLLLLLSVLPPSSFEILLFSTYSKSASLGRDRLLRVAVRHQWQDESAKLNRPLLIGQHF